MSGIYFQEPPTSGKVILVTTYGELDIELWTQETPRACRNFIQLCLEGYYDNTIFHRLIPGFMVQGGDPTGTGLGGESIYGKPFIDEFHQRLKFSHRGLVAMANSKPNDNGSQFFITFDECPWLNKKHTIFGKVVGDTIYNLMAFQNIEVDGERPLNPPKIITTKVLINPFDDMAIRATKKKKENVDEIKPSTTSSDNTSKLTTKRKPKKDINLLSFGEDEDVQLFANEKNNDDKKIVSSHDVLNDPHLAKEPVISKEELEKRNKVREQDIKKKADLKSKVSIAAGMANDDSISNDEISFNEQLKMSLLHKKRILAKENPNIVNIATNNLENTELSGLKIVKNKRTGKTEIVLEKESSESESSSESSGYSTDPEEYVDEKERELRKLQKEEYEKLKIDLLQFKKNKLGTANPEQAQRIQDEKKLLSALELKRLKYIEGKQIQRHEEDLMDKLGEFKKKLNSETIRQDKEAWMNNRLRFHIDSAKAYSLHTNKEKVNDIKDQIAAEGGQILRKQIIDDENDENIKKMKLDDIISIDQLIKMTEKK